MSTQVTDRYFSGQGKVYLGEIDQTTKKPKGFLHVGNATGLKIAFKTDVEDLYESMSGNQLLAQRIPRKKTSDISLQIQNVSKENLAIALYGSVAAVTGASVTAESKVAYLGTDINLLYPSVTSVVVKGTGAKSAVTYVLNKNYTVDATFGTIYLMTTAEQTAASAVASIAASDVLAIDYTYAAHSIVKAFASNSKEYVLRYEGINTSNSGSKFLVTIHRFVPDPLKDWSLIADKAGEIDFSGGALADTSRASDDQFASYIEL